MERKITIEEPKIYQEDYQMRILRVNEIEGILSIKGRGMDGISYYDYNVSGKLSMQAMYERNKMTGEDIKIFLKGFLKVIKELENYLLNIDCILLEPEYIFYEENQYFFCYQPQVKQDLWERFHKLTEYFVKRADYGDKECVRMVFVLHRETMKENYNLEKIVRECLNGETKEAITEEGGKEQETEKKKDGESENMDKMEYDTSAHDWIQEQEYGRLIMEETDNMWIPVKRFLHRHKRPKWGDWDGLYIEEEEL